MTAQKLECCFIDRTQCPETPSWGFQDSNDPHEYGYACRDHLGHLIDDSLPANGEPMQTRVVWPLLNGYDPTMCTHEELVAAGAF